MKIRPINRMLLPLNNRCINAHPIQSENDSLQLVGGEIEGFSVFHSDQFVGGLLHVYYSIGDTL